MPVKPLRSHAVANPKTKGERIRYARIASNLSLQELADAIKVMVGGKVTRSQVSRWERDDIKNPNNINMLAIQGITGFSADWLVRGKGPQKAVVPSADAVAAAAIDVPRLARALEAANPGATSAQAHARIVGALYDLIGDTPDIEPSLLARIAATLARG
jgi:transcriptional regulator with XRE-family HTH domain